MFYSGGFAWLSAILSQLSGNRRNRAEYQSRRYTAISELLINGKIGDREIRLIGSQGQQVGIMNSREALRLARLFGCQAAVLKERSPSCGAGQIYDGTFAGRLIPGNGVCAQRLLDAGIKVYGESQALEAGRPGGSHKEKDAP